MTRFDVLFLSTRELIWLDTVCVQLEKFVVLDKVIG